MTDNDDKGPMARPYYDSLIQCHGCGGIVSGEAAVVLGKVWHPCCVPEPPTTYVVRRTEHAFADVEAWSLDEAVIRAKTLDPQEFSVRRASTSWTALEDGEHDVPKLPKKE